METSTPQGVQGVPDRIICTFDRDLGPAPQVEPKSTAETSTREPANPAPAESEADAAPSAETPATAPLHPIPMQLEPAVAGEWRWHDARTLAFHPESPFPRGRIYRLIPRADFQAVTGYRLEDPAPREFPTGALRVEQMRIDAIDDDLLAVAFRFDQRVLPSELAGAIQVVANGQPIPARLRDEAASEEIVLDFERVDATRYSVRIEKGLAAVGGELPLESTFVSRLHLPKAFAFLSAEATGENRWRKASILLRFSEALDPEVTRRPFEIEPAVPQQSRTLIRKNQVQIDGQFTAGEVHSITIPRSVLAASGQTLEEARVVTVTIPDRTPSVDFPLGRGILAPEGNRALPLRAVNLTSLDFGVSRVHDNNLVSHLLGNSAWETSRALGKKSLELPLRPNLPHELSLDLAELLGDEARGIFAIRARAKSPSYVSDAAVVSISDLGLRARTSPTEAVVWVHSIVAGTPVPGAMVTLLTRNNQTIASAVTHADGIAYLDLPRSRPDGDPFVAIVSHGGDQGFLRLDRTPDAVRGVDLSGAPWPRGYEVFLTAERGVARPGETVHFAALVRDDEGSVPPPLPLEWHFYRPDGREVDRAVNRATAESQGFIEHHFTTDASAPTGLYEVTITLPGGGAVLGRTDLLVEHFLPVRLEVAASIEEEQYGPVRDPEISVSARRLAGGAAEGLPWAVVARFEPRRYRSARFPDHRFQIAGTRGTHTTTRKSLEIDDEGEGLAGIPAPVQVALKGGLWEVIAAATVTEPGSRSVSSTARTRYDASGRHLGLRAPASGVTPSTPFEVSAVLVDGEDRPTVGRAQFEFVRTTYTWNLRDTGRGATWQRDEHETVLESGDLVFAAESPEVPIELTAPEYGSYTLKVVDLETELEMALSLQCWGSRGAPPEQEYGEQLALALPDGTVEPGSTISVGVAAPFDGRLLYSLESDRSLHAGAIDDVARDGSFTVEIPEGVRGTLFLSATMLRPVDPTERDWRPHRAYGIARVPLPIASHRLPIAIHELDSRGDLAELTPARPLEKRTLVIETEPAREGENPAVVQLWGVDSGVLLATGFETPDPFDTFLAARRAVVRGVDLFGDLLPDGLPPSDLTFIGGDRERQRRARTSPVTVDGKDSAVVWCGAVPVDADGRATFEIETPDLIGEMTWFAIGATGDRYGAARVAHEVSTPIVVESPWPRFVAPGDRFVSPLVLSNRTRRDLQVLPALTVTGPLVVTFDVPPEGLRLPAGERVTVPVSAHATAPGSVSIEARVVPIGDGDSVGSAVVTTSLAVRPVTAFRRDATAERVGVGTRLEFSSAKGFYPGTAKSRVWLRASPQVELVPAIAELVDYPHGCVEQTSSRLFALAVALDPRVGFVDGAGREEAVLQMARAGIARLDRMRNRDGGLGYWPGNDSSVWGSTHALEALTAVDAAGVSVPSALLTGIREFLRSSLAREGKSAVNVNTRTRILRLLATDPEPPRGRIARWTERFEHLDLGGRVDLAEAWRRLGEPERARALIAGDLDALPLTTMVDDRITSPVAQRARLLSLLVALTPDDPRLNHLRSSIAKARVGGRWRNTYENACAIVALARAGGDERSVFTGTATIDGVAHPFSETKPVQVTIDEGTSLVVETEGAGSFSAVRSTEGMSSELPTPFTRGLEISRVWKTAEGEVIEPGATLAVGDLVVVTTTIRTPRSPRTVRNIAIVDALPGGLEPENPRLITSASAALGVSSAPDRIEFLDDRVLIFTSAGANVRTYRYALRASTVGTFQVPPLEASSMYDPDLGALTAGGTLEITP